MSRLQQIIVTLLALYVSPAMAGDGIVLESHTGARPEDAARVVAPALDELAKLGYVGGAEAVGRKFEARASRAARVRGLPVDLEEQVDRGHRAWIAGKFEEAVRILVPLVDAVHENPGAFAQAQPRREHVLKALIALALSQQRLGDRGAARQAFIEILRSFPETTVSRAAYGPEAYDLFDQIRKDAGAGGRGSLIVKVSDGAATVYINERLENAGAVTREGLLAGEYRVFAQRGRQVSRVHRVTVRPNDRALLVIDLDLDDAVHTSPDWAGLQFSSSAVRERSESAYAAAFANAIDARAVAIVGIDQVRGRPAVVGTLVNLMTGREIRRASVALEPAPPADRLRALARFLDDNQPAPGVEVQPVGEAPAALTAAPRHEDRPTEASRATWGGWKYLTGGVALAALATGGALLYTDGTCPGGAATCAELYDHAAWGWASLGAGAALAGVTVYLFLSSGGVGEQPARAAYVMPTPGGAFAGIVRRF